MDITLLQHSKDNQPGRTTVDEAARLIRGEGRPEGYQPLLVFAADERQGLYVVRRKIDEIDSEMRLLAREKHSESQMPDEPDVF